MAHVFITGGTGFIGTHIIQQLIKDKHRITALVRSREKFESIRQFLQKTGQEPDEPLTQVIGDLSLPSLGLSLSEAEHVHTADIIIHAGGPMNILLDEQTAQKVFLQGAEEILKLADRIHQTKGLQQLIHVVGFKSPVRDDSTNDPKPVLAQIQHAPPYERLKIVADLHIRQGAQQAGYPLSVVHPSVVIGSSVHGDTPQTGGLGILVGAAAKNLMRLAPGGSAHWLPLVHVDHVADFIAALVKESTPVSQTYYLLDDPNASPNMKHLVAMLSRELRAGRPLGSISIPILSKVLGSRLGRLLGIPKDSLDFIVPKSYDFPLGATRLVQRNHKLTQTVNPAIMPHIVSDLDHRIQHASRTTQSAQAQSLSRYTRGRRGPLASLERQCSSVGKGPTIVFVHGTLSGADCLLPLADQFEDAHICLLDLPGFGRSPHHHRQDTLQAHAEALTEAIASFSEPVTLVGHSFGGYAATQAMQLLPGRIGALYLLQPALQPLADRYSSRRMNELALGLLGQSGLQKQLLAQACFQTAEEIPADYTQYVLSDLRSPRARKANAETLAALTRADAFHFSFSPNELQRIHFIWGTRDFTYKLPEYAHSMNLIELPYAHNFPISHPEQTATALRNHGILNRS